MKIKHLLTKTLLVAAGLLVGQSALAQTTTLLEYGTGDVAWTKENVAEWTAGGSPALADGIVTISGGNGSYETSKAITPTANAIINVTAVWRGASSTGRAFSAGNGSYFRFGNIYVAQNDQDQKHGYGFTGLSNIGSVTTFTAGSYRVDVTSSTWLKIEAEINTATNTLTSFTIKSEDGATTYATVSDVALTSPDYTTVAFGYRKSGRVSTTNKEQLKSVKITETQQVVSTADYTIKYVCGGVEVKPAVVRTSIVGSDITLIDSDKESFYNNDNTKKYIYDGDGSEVSGKTVLGDGSAVVEVPFREAAIWAWTASSNHGSFTASGSTFEGDKVNISYPLYVFEGNKLYTKAANNSTYNQQYDITKDNEVFTLEYSDADIDAIFYTEAEDVVGMTKYDGGNASARSSQRAVGYTETENVVFTTLPAGKYKIVGSYYSPTSAGGHFYIYAGNRVILDNTVGNANATAFNAEFVLVKESNKIAFGKGGGYTSAFDYVYIQQLATPTAEEITAAEAADHAADYISVTVKTTGTTFSSAYAIDCDKLPAGVKAYKVTKMTASEVTASEVTGQVAANTGLILKADVAKSYDIPVVASGVAVEDNLLKAAVTATPVAADQAYGLKDGKFHKLNAGTIPAGKAYLLASDVTAPELSIVFEGNLTGISVASATSKNEGVVYDLQGRKVANPTKGLYIQNGRKVILK